MFGMNPMGGVNQGGMPPQAPMQQPMQQPMQRPPMAPMQRPPMAQPQPMQNPQMMQQLAQAQALRAPPGTGMPHVGISGAPLQGGMR
jgi:hypothetical protein